MTVTAEQALPNVAVRRRTKFFMGLAIAILALVIVGFARTFYLRPFFGAVDGPTRSTELPWHLLVHGIVMTAWFGLVVAQSVLIAKRHVALHRRLGIAGVALAVLVIVVGMWTVIELLLRRDAAGVAIGARQRDVVIGDTIVLLLYFPLLIAAGFLLRRDAESHKRLMLMSSIVMLGPVIARYGPLLAMAGLPIYLLVLLSPIPLLLALFIYDITTRKFPHWATVCGIVMVAAYGRLKDWLMTTDAGNAYIEWLRQLGA